LENFRVNHYCVLITQHQHCSPKINNNMKFYLDEILNDLDDKPKQSQYISIFHFYQNLNKNE
jgi:hypothetical protein